MTQLTAEVQNIDVSDSGNYLSMVHNLFWQVIHLSHKRPLMT